MDLGYYSPMNVTASILGKKIEGFADDSFISIEAQNDSFQTKMSMDGMVQVVGSPVTMHNVKISLQATSPMNSVLFALLTLHKQFGSKLRIPLIIKSEDTNTSFSATEVWFKREPNVTLGSSMGIIEWDFITKNAVRSIGGNSDGGIDDLAGMISQATQLAGYLDLDLGSMLGTASGFFSSISI